MLLRTTNPDSRSIEATRAEDRFVRRRSRIIAGMPGYLASAIVRWAATPRWTT
jgi:hypothetical protein